MADLTVYLGYDETEREAYEVSRRSIWRHAPGLRVVPVHIDWLTRQGLMRRPTCKVNGQAWDVLSDAPQSTDFAVSRFLVPLLHQTGWALFMDCDTVALTDVRRIIDEADATKAVHVVKHKHEPTEAEKMCGKVQTRYARKNWSSVMLWNCDHDGCKRLTAQDINRLPGRDLHAFRWLHDDEIGELSPGWNWLVNVQAKPEPLHVAHFTLGGPWLDGWPGADHDELWLAHRREGGSFLTQRDGAAVRAKKN